MGAIIAGVQAFEVKQYTLLQTHARIAITVRSSMLVCCSSQYSFQILQVWHVGSATADVLIAVSMCYYVRFFLQIWVKMLIYPLQLWKRDTGFKRTHTAIIRLIQLTIETGTATGK